MLDEKDLQAIAQLMDEKIGASEARMAAYMKEEIGASEARMTAYMKEEIGASEARMTEKIEASEARMTEKIEASEARMTEKIEASEARMAEKIEASEARMTERTETRAQDSESRMLAMMEAYFEPRFQLLGDQIKLIQEKLTPPEALEDLEGRVQFVEGVVKQHSREIEMLKKAL